MLLGFRNGQIELARKGVDLVAEPSVVLESCVQPPLQQVISIVRGGQLRGDVVLGADLGVEFVFQVGVPVGQDAIDPRNLTVKRGFRTEPGAALLVVVRRREHGGRG